MSATTRTQCFNWCEGDCENDFHRSKVVMVDTIEEPVPVDLTFGADSDPEPLIVLNGKNVLLTRAQALDLAMALTQFAGAARKG